MSTDIRNAWRLPVGADPFDEIAPLREAVVGIQLAEDAREIVGTAVRIVDELSLHRDPQRMILMRGGQPASPLRPWRSAIEHLAYAESQESQAEWGTDRQRFEIQFVRDDADNRLCALRYAENPRIIAASDEVMRSRGWADWHYQNRSDKPEEVSEEEWEQRKKSWDRILDLSAPAEVGLGLSIKPRAKFGTTPSLTGLGPGESEAIESVETPTREERLDKIIHRAQFDRIDSREGETDISELMSLVGAAEDARRALRATPVWDDLLAEVFDLDVEDLRSHHEEPLVTHTLTEEKVFRALDA